MATKAMDKCTNCDGEGSRFMAREGANLFYGQQPWRRLERVGCWMCNGTGILANQYDAELTMREKEKA